MMRPTRRPMMRPTRRPMGAETGARRPTWPIRRPISSTKRPIWPTKRPIWSTKRPSTRKPEKRLPMWVQVMINIRAGVPPVKKSSQKKHSKKTKPLKKFTSLGCWKDSWFPAVPSLEGKNGKPVDRSSKNAIERCYEMAKVLGLEVFAVQKGWCGGLKKGKGYMRYGRSKDCINGTGGKKANSVYRLVRLGHPIRPTRSTSRPSFFEQWFDIFQ